MPDTIRRADSDGAGHLRCVITTGEEWRQWPEMMRSESRSAVGTLRQPRGSVSMAVGRRRWSRDLLPTSRRLLGAGLRRSLLSWRLVLGLEEQIADNANFAFQDTGL